MAGTTNSPANRPPKAIGTLKNKPENDIWFRNYEDRFQRSSPVGTYGANSIGVFDLGGNLREWVMGDSSEQPALPGRPFAEGPPGFALEIPVAVWIFLGAGGLALLATLGMLLTRVVRSRRAIWLEGSSNFISSQGLNGRLA